MTDIAQLSKWNRDISKAIAALGTEQFFPALIAAISGPSQGRLPPGLAVPQGPCPPECCFMASHEHAVAFPD